MNKVFIQEKKWKNPTKVKDSKDIKTIIKYETIVEVHVRLNNISESGKKDFNEYEVEEGKNEEQEIIDNRKNKIGEGRENYDKEWLKR